MAATKQAKRDDSLIEVAKANANLCRDNDELRASVKKLTAKVKELTPVRVCADCKHYAPVLGLSGIPLDKPWCLRSPKGLVEGGATKRCWEMRWHGADCGEDAKLFEPKPTEPEQIKSVIGLGDPVSFPLRTETAPPNPPQCKDCRWASSRSPYAKCKHPLSDPTGNDGKYCSIVRMFANEECGPKGKLFERKQRSIFTQWLRK